MDCLLTPRVPPPRPPLPATLPPGTELDCGCDPHFARHVFETAGLTVASCLHCGRVLVTDPICEEPRPHDVRLVHNEIVPIDPGTLAWLAEWPRRSISDKETLLPAAARSATVDDLRAAEALCAKEQLGLTRLERLRRVGYPARPPPAELPRKLAIYLELHEAASEPSGPLESLFPLFARSTWAIWLYEHELTRWDGLADAIEKAMRDPVLSAMAFELARQRKIVTPGILAVLGERIDAITTQTPNAISALYLAGGLGPAARPVLANLDRALARVDRNREYYFHKTILDTIAHCRRK